MLFRVKITKCIDIIVESNDLNNILGVVNDFLKNCSKAEKIYIHILERKNNELVDKELVYMREVKVD